MTALTVKDKLCQLTTEKKYLAGEYADPAVLFDTTELNELNCRLSENQGGHCLLREKRFPVNFTHSEEIGQFLKISPQDFNLLGKAVLFNDIHPVKVIFIDTETTGLAGGTGTYVFLIGLGFFTDEAFFIRQILMPDFSQESALLVELERIIADRNAIISFNGKSYDIPLLKTRFLLHKMQHHLPDAHLDLLHTSRRLWKNIYNSCSLQSLEKNVLGFSRLGDVEGSEIPGIYFNFLRDRRLAELKSIFQHNAIDLLSLVSISIKAWRAFSSADGSNDILFDRKGVISSLESLKLFELAAKRCETFTASAKDGRRNYFLLKQSMNLKKAGKIGSAAELWIKMITNGYGFTPDAYIELAKYYEHKLHDYEAALACVNKLERRIALNRELGNDPVDDFLLLDLPLRKNRIMGKMSKRAYGKH